MSDPPRRLSRPQTTKEVRRAYLKRGGSTYVSKEERRRLLREVEQENARNEKQKKDKARKNAAKKRAENEAKQREERRRLGIPDPLFKVEADQMRIGGFLKSKRAALNAEPGCRRDPSLDTDVHQNILAGTALASSHANHDMEPRPRRATDIEIQCPEELQCDSLPKNDLHSDGECGTNVKVVGVPTEEDDQGDNSGDDQGNSSGDDQGDQTDCRLSPRTRFSENSERMTITGPTPRLPALDLRSSFFASNSQIDREVNRLQSTSPISPSMELDSPKLPPLILDGAPIDAYKTHNQHEQHMSIASPDQAEIERLLSALPSQDLDFI